MRKEEMCKVRRLSMLESKSQVLHELSLWSEKSCLLKQEGQDIRNPFRHMYKNNSFCYDYIQKKNIELNKIIPYISHFKVNLSAQ